MLNNLPTSWHEVTLFQWIELEKAFNRVFESLSEYGIEIASILLNTTPDDQLFDDLEWDSIQDILDSKLWLFKDPPTNYSVQIDNYKLKNFKQMTLGEFIDIEYFIENEDIYKIIPILYKRFKIDEWENVIFEPHMYSLDARMEFFLDQPMTKVYGVIKSYFEFRDSFLSSYENLFIPNDTVESGEDEELTGRDKIEAMKAELEQKTKSKWSWESILLGLTNGDVTKFDKLFETSLILVFNTLSAKKVLEI